MSSVPSFRLRPDARALTAIVGLAVVLRLAWVALASHALGGGSDEITYRQLARSLAAGEGFARGGHASAWQVPGWPAFMAAVYRLAGDADAYVYLANVALAAMTAVLVYMLARRLFSSRVALIAALLVAIWPASVVLSDTLMSENLATPLLLAVILLALPRRDTDASSLSVRRVVLTGLTCGLLILVREQNYFVPLAIGGYWLLTSRFRAAAPRAVLVCAVCAMTLTPWLLRNHEVMGVDALSTSSGYNLNVSLSDKANGGYVLIDLDRFSLPVVQNDVEPLAANEVALNEQARSNAVSWAFDHPLRVVALVPVRLAQTVLNERWALWYIGGYTTTETLSAPWLLATGLLEGFWLLTLALAGLAVFTRSQLRRDCLLLGALAVALLTPHLIMFGLGRFHMTLAPLVFVAAAYALVEVVPELAQRQARADLSLARKSPA